MELKVFNYNYLPAMYIDEVEKILEEVDDEFIPPLSSRINTTQESFPLFDDVIACHNSLYLYFGELKKQSIIVAKFENSIVGFLSYIRNHGNSLFCTPAENVYITTICVVPRFRNQKIANRMYEALEREYCQKYIYTRTWESNIPHIKLLLSRGYELIYEVDNDRPNGENTVYYGKEVDLLVKKNKEK